MNWLGYFTAKNYLSDDIGRKLLLNLLMLGKYGLYMLYAFFKFVIIVQK